MPNIYSGRFTADTDEPFVVFLIGMRINQAWALHKWLPTAMAMEPMLSSLYQNPESGYLGGEAILYRGGIGLIQYWRTTEDLEHFARSPQEAHRKAWQQFNKAVRKNSSVGIWHETYQVAAATSHVPVGKRGESARERLSRA